MKKQNNTTNNKPILEDTNEDVIIAGGFRGEESLPPGGFRAEELPPGGFRNGEATVV